MTDHPPPMTTPEIDVRDLDGFMLNTERLLASELWALATGEEFKGAMGLWCRAWKQIPAASLPNDERVLASFAGVALPRWKKIREVAMRGFVLCSDGRLYHRVLCDDALRAHARKQERRAQTLAATESRRQRNGQRDVGFTDDATGNVTLSVTRSQGQEVEVDGTSSTPSRGSTDDPPASGALAPGAAPGPAADRPKDENAKLREVLARFGVATNRQATAEWRGLLQVRAGITRWVDVERFMALCVQSARLRSVQMRYARDAYGLADDWRQGAVQGAAS